MSKILILSGPVESGKTTYLQKFIIDSNCDGIISPIINGQRYLQRIKTKEKKLLDSTDGKGFRIGKHTFDEKSFSWARDQLLQILNSDIDYIVIDEIGPLEIGGRGFEPILSYIFEKYKNNRELNLAVVVRDTLVNKVIENYQLDRNLIEIKKPGQD